MNTKKQHTEQDFKSPNGGLRGLYITPRIEHIVLDNAISLAMESDPPEGPYEGASLSPEFMKVDPFSNNLG